MPAALVSPPTGADVALHLGAGDDETLTAQAGFAVGVAFKLAKSYTRGEGFEAGGTRLADDLAVVVLLAAARIVQNPEQVQREQWGDYSVLPTTSWSLVELAVLNRYRKRAQ